MLFAIARAGSGLGCLRRRVVMSAGRKAEDRNDEEPFGDVFHTKDHRGWPNLACMNVNQKLHNHEQHEMRFRDMLLILAILLLLFWGGGFAFHVAGGLIHVLLVVALIVFILHFARSGRSN